MNSSLISQIVLVIVSIVLIVMYIRPGFETITELQSEQGELQDAIDTADEFTRALQQLQAKVDSISSADMTALQTYLPNEADRLTTMWVLESIASDAGVSIASIAAAGTENDSGSNTDESVSTSATGTSSAPTRPTADGLTLTVGVTGTYDNFKSFLRLLEVNEFPFLTQKLVIGSAVGSEGGASGGESAEGSASGDGAYTLTLLVPEFQPPEAAGQQQAREDDMMMEDDMF